MDESLKARIKDRDRWTCRVCGVRFVDLTLAQFTNKESSEPDDQWLTICDDCGVHASENIDESLALFTRLVRRNKIVLVGDCHGRLVDLYNVLEQEEPFDFFLSVGDVCSWSDVTASRIVLDDKYTSRGYYVKGNHDVVQILNSLSLLQEIRGIKIAGLNGMVRPRDFVQDTPNNISFREVMYLSHTKDIDILVSHQPPAGLHKDTGEPILTELLQYTVPKVYISGHVHRFKMKFYLNTFMISLPMIDKGHAVAYFQGSDLRNVELVLKKGKRTIRV